MRYSSAQKTIDKLVKAGILKELTGQKRNRIYLAAEILAAVQDSTQAGAE